MENIHEQINGTELGIRFDINEELLGRKPNDLTKGKLLHTGHLGPNMSIELVVSDDIEENHFYAVLITEGTGENVFEPFHHDLNTIDDVKSVITGIARSYFDFSELKVGRDGFLTKNLPFLHFHTKETLAVYEKGLVLSEDEIFGDYICVLLGKGVCNAVFRDRKDSLDYPVELTGIDPVKIIEGLYRTEYSFKEMVSDFLEVTDELDNSGHYDYNEILELEEKRDTLRKAIQKELAKDN